jgi:hypothetical protein
MADIGHCARCGRAREPGRTWDEVSVRVAAGFDGVVDQESGDLGSALAEAAEKTEEQLMNEVFERLRFTLCKPCREAWVKSPAGGPEDLVPGPGQLH